VENIEPIKMIKVSPCAKGLHKNEYHAMWSPYGNVVERVWHRIDQWWYWWMAVCSMTSKGHSPQGQGTMCPTQHQRNYVQKTF